jgi:hypothetical protein
MSGAKQGQMNLCMSWSPSWSLVTNPVNAAWRTVHVLEV